MKTKWQEITVMEALVKYLGKRNARLLAKEIDEGLAKGLKGKKLYEWIDAAIGKAMERANRPKEEATAILLRHIVARQP